MLLSFSFSFRGCVFAMPAEISDAEIAVLYFCFRCSDISASEAAFGGFRFVFRRRHAPKLPPAIRQYSPFRRLRVSSFWPRDSSPLPPPPSSSAAGSTPGGVQKDAPSREKRRRPDDRRAPRRYATREAAATIRDTRSAPRYASRLSRPPPSSAYAGVGAGSGEARERSKCAC